MNVPQAAARLGISYRQLDHWTRKGWISIPASGSGNARTITREQLQQLTCLTQLVHAGLRPDRAAAALNQAVTDSHGHVHIHLGPVHITVHPEHQPA